MGTTIREVRHYYRWEGKDDKRGKSSGQSVADGVAQKEICTYFARPMAAIWSNLGQSG